MMQPPLRGHVGISTHAQRCNVQDFCASRNAKPSLIILNRHGQRQAGLFDRTLVLHGVTTLAAGLCAKVYTPPPCVLLSPGHNKAAAPLSCKHSWSRYFHLNHSGDNTPMLVNMQERNRLLKQPHKLVNDRNIDDLTKASKTRTDGKEVMQAYVKALHMVADGERFAWTIDTNYWDWAERLQNYLLVLRYIITNPNGTLLTPLAERWAPTPYVLPFSQRHGLDPWMRASAALSCFFVNLTAPAPALKAREGFAAAMGYSSADSLEKLLVIHLRRGDKSDGCDTSLEALMSLFSCRLKPPRKGKKGGGIALFTDETNRTYIETLTTWLAARQKAVVRHGDAIVTTLLGPEDGADNYMVYTAMGAIMDAAGAAWRIGFGGTCPTQDNVTHGALCDVPYIKEPKHFEVDLRHISPFEWKRTDW